MARRSARATAARRYHGALRAIRAKHATATHRDAQYVYRILKRQTGGATITGRQVQSARLATTARALTQARREGSRTVKLTPAKQAAETKKAKKFGGKRGEQKNIIGGGGGAAAPRETEGGGGGAAETDEGDEDDIEPQTAEEWDALYDDYAEDAEDFEVETSPDYEDING